MNNKEFISELSSRTGYSVDATQQIVRQVIERMSQSFDEGDSVFMAGFGTFEVKKRGAAKACVEFQACTVNKG